MVNNWLFSSVTYDQKLVGSFHVTTSSTTFYYITSPLFQLGLNGNHETRRSAREVITGVSQAKQCDKKVHHDI